jgi:hypothetical protein
MILPMGAESRCQSSRPLNVSQHVFPENPMVQSVLRGTAFPDNPAGEGRV